MAYERNDIVTKNRLAGELGEGLMGYEHNDIVTVDKMNEAIAEGGGGGGAFDLYELTATIVTIGEGDDTFNAIGLNVSYNDIVGLVSEGKLPYFTPTAEMASQFSLYNSNYYVSIFGVDPSVAFYPLCQENENLTYEVYFQADSATDNLVWE